MKPKEIKRKDNKNKIARKLLGLREKERKMKKKGKRRRDEKEKSGKKIDRMLKDEKIPEKYHE